MTGDIGRILQLLEKRYGKEEGMEWESREHNRFQLLIGTILSARTRDENTEKASEKLFRKYPTAQKLAGARLSEIRKLIRPSGYYNLKAGYIKETSRVLLEKFKGKVPDSMEELLKLPGVGRKVAGCVLVYGFGKAENIPVDTHVHRVSNRLGLAKTKAPEQTEKVLMKAVPKRYWLEINSLFVVHGKTICKSIRPLCPVCPVNKYCDYYYNAYRKDG
jgi:endonuclease-3